MQGEFRQRIGATGKIDQAMLLQYRKARKCSYFWNRETNS